MNQNSKLMITMNLLDLDSSIRFVQCLFHPCSVRLGFENKPLLIICEHLSHVHHFLNLSIFSSFLSGKVQLFKLCMFLQEIH